MNRDVVDQADDVMNAYAKRTTVGNQNAGSDYDHEFVNPLVDEIQQKKDPVQNYLHEPVNDCGGDFDAVQMLRYDRHA
ncbi:hypothetical protein PC116_g30515 [Phytophthora cactorum]|nr:hypothetical protein PC116_g30515 [Phytophthora cactorum]